MKVDGGHIKRESGVKESVLQVISVPTQVITGLQRVHGNRLPLRTRRKADVQAGRAVERNSGRHVQIPTLAEKTKRNERCAMII